MNNGFNNNGFQQPQGGFQQPQGGFQQPQGQFNPNQNTGGNGGGSNSPSFSEITIIARLTEDPKSEVMSSGAKVAKATIANNHRGQDAPTDFWNIEVWVNQGGRSSTHDFLMDYCKSGRQVFVKGIPHLKRRKRQNNGQDVLDPNGKAIYDYYPTIRVNELMGLGAGQNKGNNSGSGQQQQTQQNNFQNQGNPQQFQGQQPQGGLVPPQGGFGGPGVAPQQPQGQQFGPPQGQFVGQ